MTQPLYRRLLGPRFDALPERVRTLHDLTGTATWVGRADVERGTSWGARIAGAIAGLPPAGRGQPLRVTFEPARDGTETWTRAFGPAVFRSTQSQRGMLLCEQVGPVALIFALEAAPDGLALKLEAVRALGIPLPRVLHPSVTTSESERDGLYRFCVESHLPLFGLLVRYSGWLKPEA